MKPQKKKVEAILRATQPRTKKQLRQFLGLVGYYSHFIQDCHESITLDRLSQKQTSRLPELRPTGTKGLQGSTTCPHHAAGALKTRLHATVYSANGCFKLWTWCGPDPDLRRGRTAEQKYSITESEALAVKWAIETLQFYLVNNPFTLLSDHAPLQWLHKVKNSNPCSLRWYLSLLPFSFQVIHHKGSANSNAD